MRLNSLPLSLVNYSSLFDLELTYLFKGVFVAKGDVGIGTIVGSAVFNVLVIIGLCAVLCDEVPKIKPNLYQGEFPCMDSLWTD